MNAMEILSRAGVYSREIEKLLDDAIKQKNTPSPVVPSPIKIEEDQWLEPMGRSATIILRDSL